jgi:hypothetical protein
MVVPLPRVRLGCWDSIMWDTQTTTGMSWFGGEQQQQAKQTDRQGDASHVHHSSSRRDIQYLSLHAPAKVNLRACRRHPRRTRIRSTHISGKGDLQEPEHAGKVQSVTNNDLNGWASLPAASSWWPVPSSAALPGDARRHPEKAPVCFQTGRCCPARLCGLVACCELECWPHKAGGLQTT